MAPRNNIWVLLEKIAHDLKTSWYFRLWAVLWGICLVVGFVGLIIFSARSSKNAKHEDLSLWNENVSTLYFPRFHFRTGWNENEKILSITCTHNGNILETGICALGYPQDMVSCTAVFADRVFATNNVNVPDQDSRVYCQLTTTLNATGNVLLAWEVEGENVVNFGGTSGYASIWMAPRNNIWVLLEKIILTSGKSKLDAWHRDLLYHSTVARAGFFNVSTVLDTFRVTHQQSVDEYNGWMSTGNIGGFAFFLLILHGLIVLVSGVFLTNTSTFLKPNQNEQL